MAEPIALQVNGESRQATAGLSLQQLRRFGIGAAPASAASTGAGLRTRERADGTVRAGEQWPSQESVGSLAAG